MSLPTFPTEADILSRPSAFNAILTGIAMTEAGLSHVINAEGMKIESAIALSTSTEDIEGLIAIDASVAATLERVTEKEIVINNILRTLLGAIDDDDDEDPDTGGGDTDGGGDGGDTDGGDDRAAAANRIIRKASHCV